MTPLKDYRTHSIVISKFFRGDFFILRTLITKRFTLITSIPSFTVPCVRYIINTYSIVNVTN